VKRSLPIVIVLILALLAIGVGWGTNKLLAWGLTVPAEEMAKIAPPEGEEVPAEDGALLEPLAVGGVRVPNRREYVDGILRRNIFDSEFIDTYNPSVTKNADGEDLVETDLKLILVATLVANISAHSAALISDDSKEARAHGYGIGSTIQNTDAEVIEIEQKRVTLRRSDGSIETLFAEGETVTTASKTSSATGEGDDEVQEIGENKYLVSREMVDSQMNDLEGLSRMGRALLHRGADGQYDGYRMSAIRRDTLADKLGIRNGDIVHGVNDMPLTSMQGAMGAFTALQNEAEFNFEITRRGQKVTLEYEIR
jgi:type II secretion system protein C